MLLRLVLVEQFACTVYILRVFCQIHQLMLGVYSLNALSNHIGPLFCATSLLHRGAINDAFTRELPGVLSDLVQV